MVPKELFRPCKSVNSELDRLYLDRDGRWFHEGVEITHERTRILFLRSLHRDSDGCYYIQVGMERAGVEVEDSPFLVRSVTAHDDERGRPRQYLLQLNDGTDEWLDPRTLRVGSAHILYCAVKEATAPARFLRPAYYQLSSHVRYDEEQGVFWLPWKGGEVAIPLDPDRGGGD